MKTLVSSSAQSFRRLVAPVLAAFGLGLTRAPSNAFQLQILHASDLEGGLEAVSYAPNFGVIVDELEAEADTAGVPSILISAGDNYIACPFFGAAGDRSLRGLLQAGYQGLFSDTTLTNIREGNGRVDITIMNLLGFEASAIGNHDFDAGFNTFAGLIETDIRTPINTGNTRWLVTQFPYLSANLDFSADGKFGGLVTPDILPNTDFQSLPSDLVADAAAPKTAGATAIDVGGEKIGVLGATTQFLQSITSSGGVVNTAGTSNDMPALAAGANEVDSGSIGFIRFRFTPSGSTDVLNGWMRAVLTNNVPGGDPRLRLRVGSAAR
ncbi:MAG: hypothetical protein AAGJ79_00865 [Verrucomicrobiota bacterium]